MNHGRRETSSDEAFGGYYAFWVEGSRASDQVEQDLGLFLLVGLG